MESAGQWPGIYIFKEEGWTTINRKHYPQIDSLLDYITVAVDPADQTIWAGSFGGGLLHIKADQSFEIFKQNFLGPALMILQVIGYQAWHLI